MDHVIPSAALAPVRAALVSAARHDAELVQTRAEQAATRTVEEAAAAATRIRAEAREQGAADATAALTAERAQVGRRARAVVLRAQREEYEALRSAARRAVAALLDDPDYPRLRLRMVDIIRGVLGRDCELSEGELGGVIGEGPGRRLDYSLAGFADRAADAVAAELAAGEPAAVATDGGRHR